MKGAAVLTDRPTVLSRDEQGRLHNETGPALAYADGYTFHAWHGTRVPADLIETGWRVEKIMAEANTEIRRCAIEKIGWDAMIAHLDEKPIDTCPDPGNAPHELKLYRLPDKVNPYREPVNLLFMTNGSPDRSGERRRYGETVPVRVKTVGRDGKKYPPALASAAWQYGVDPSVYARTVRRT
jgi:hypothetical protein